MSSSEVKGVYTIVDSKRLSWLLIPMILKACPKNNYASRKSPSNAAKQKSNNKYCAGQVQPILRNSFSLVAGVILSLSK